MSEEDIKKLRKCKKKKIHGLPQEKLKQQLEQVVERKKTPEQKIR